MIALKEALDQKYRYQVDASNVFSWENVAGLCNMRLINATSEMILVVKFMEVIQHKEFIERSKDEVMACFKACKLHSGISNDDLLQAALKWMEDNEPFPELIEQLDLTKVVTLHWKMPLNVNFCLGILLNINDSGSTKQEKQQTVVYITAHGGVIPVNNLRWQMSV